VNLRALVALSLLALTTTAGAADTPSASGSFEFRGKKYRPAHAVAQAGPFLEVVLSDTPFDPRWAGDGVLTESDLMAHPSISATIKIDAERRQFYRITFRDRDGSGADLRCEDPAVLTLNRIDATGVSGTFKCEEHDFTFDAPMLPASPGK
jgi:hypothetical protein